MAAPLDPDDSQPWAVRITLRDVYDSAKATESQLALLASSMRHAEDWRNEADHDIRGLMERTSMLATRREVDALERTVDGCVTRRELYSVVGLVAAVVSAASPFLAQLYNR